MDITCLSDLHGHFPKDLPGGDLLIIAGDLTARDTFVEHCAFKLWLHRQDYKKKIVIAGNHDNHFIGLVPDPYLFSSYNADTGEQKSYADYLCDSGTEFEGLRIWGSPWTKTFEGMNPKCKAFTCETEEELDEKWELIPKDIDILITHSPPYGILDKCYKGHVGSETLAYTIGSMETPPRLWVWGHIHEAYGRDQAIRQKPCIMINASHVNERYQPVNKAQRIIL